ncbi:hypothetical protein HERIO_1170 [Hepatospora eriocheir]|uniref:Uncharacterized protein n=1 Tax=Hepatospora eriocheir TaxID=1081669 RepID=A0A1X0QB72_9MICR|nr:hypothetical protein HERIO_1170 [Hepatospora eriocheir]
MNIQTLYFIGLGKYINIFIKIRHVTMKNSSNLNHDRIIENEADNSSEYEVNSDTDIDNDNDQECEMDTHMTDELVFYQEVKSIFNPETEPLYYQGEDIFYEKAKILFDFESNEICCIENGIYKNLFYLKDEESKIINNLLTKEMKENFKSYLMSNYKEEIIKELFLIEETMRSFVNEMLTRKNIDDNIKSKINTFLNNLFDYNKEKTTNYLLENYEAEYDYLISFLLAKYCYNVLYKIDSFLLKWIFNSNKTEEYYELMKCFYGIIYENYLNMPSKEFLDQIPEIDKIKNLIVANKENFNSFYIDNCNYLHLIFRVFYPDKIGEAKKDVVIQWWKIKMRLTLSFLLKVILIKFHFKLSSIYVVISIYKRIYIQ